VVPMSRNWYRAALSRMTPLVVAAAVCLVLLAAASPAVGAAVGPSSTAGERTAAVAWQRQAQERMDFLRQKEQEAREKQPD